MNEWASRIALLSTSAAAFLVLLLYAPALEAPFLVPKLAALEILASVGALAFVLRRTSAGRPRWSRLINLGVTLVLATSLASWMAALRTSTGAPYAVAALARWASLFGIACGASVVDEADGGTTRALETVTIAAMTVAGVGLLQHVGALPIVIPVFSTPGSTFGNRNIAAEVMAMSLPLGVSLAIVAPRRDARLVACFAIGFELVFLAVTRTRGAWIGAALGLSTVLWLERKRLSPKALVGITGAVLVACVAASLPGRWNPHDAGDAKRYGGVVSLLEESIDAQSPALRTRLGMWRRTLAMVRDHPWIGVGPGNWPVMFPAYAEPDAARDGVLSATLAPRQAHDDLLERAAETGVPGVLALLVLAIGVAVATRRRLQTHDRQKRTLVAGVAGALVALAAISLASFPLEMPGTIALAGLALGFVATDERRLSSPTPRGAAVPALAAALMLVSCALVRAEQGVRSSLAFGVAERALHRDHGAVGGREAIAALERSLDVTPRAFGPELREAQMWLRLGRPMESTLASMRALAVEPNSPNAWATLAAGYLASDDSPGAVTAASQALGRLRDYPLALDVRARAEEKLGKIGDAALDRDRLRDLATTATDEDTRHRARELLEER